MTAAVTIILTIFVLIHIGVRVSPASIQDRAVSRIGDFAEKWLLENGYDYFLRRSISNTMFWEELIEAFNSSPLNYIEIGFLGSVKIKQEELLILIRKKVAKFDFQIRTAHALV